MLLGEALPGGAGELGALLTVLVPRNVTPVVIGKCTCDPLACH